ncbi:MAG: TRAP transporter small permease subunit [Saprospiraceae bacterium]
MKKIIYIFDSVNEKIGRIFAWTTTLLVLVIFIDVLLRYILSFSFIWITEIEIYLFALSFLFGSGYTLKHDKHVRVDIFYEGKTPVKKAWVNLLGGLFFLIPWCLVAILSCWKYASFSFGFRESSAQAGGLPALYILKFCFVFGFVFLLMQGIALILRSVLIIMKEYKSE